MLLKQKIQSDSTDALKKGEQLKLSVLRMLLAGVATKEKEKRYKISNEKPDLKEQELIKESELTEEQMIETISSEIKKRKDAIVLYKQGNRPELVEKEQKEMEVLKKYLPEQLSKEELEKLVRESIAKIKGEMKDPSTSSGQVMGKVMADLNPKIKGKADGGQVSRIVKELLIK